MATAPALIHAAADVRTQAVERLRTWIVDPVQFVLDVFRAEPDGWQADMLRAYPHHDLLAMQACAGPGKSCVLAWIIWHFLATKTHPKIAVTGITEQNLKDNLWTELAKWQAGSPWLLSAFTWTRTRIVANDHPATWWCSLRTWDRSADAEAQGNTLAGLHAKNVLALVDEAGGVPTPVVATAKGVLATKEPGGSRHVIISGNPTHLTGPLYDSANKERADWHHMQITGDPDKPNRAPRVDIEWARKMIRAYGRESAWVRSRVLGLFPHQASDAILGLDHMQAAVERTMDVDGEPLLREPVAIGIDVARFGNDSTVICTLAGDFLMPFVEWKGKDTTYSTNRIAHHAIEVGATTIRVDDVGVGGAVTDQLMNWAPEDAELEQAWDTCAPMIEGVNVGQAATEPGPDGKPMYQDLRTQLAFKAADRVKAGMVSISDPNGEEQLAMLIAEATDMRYGFDRRGKLLVLEPKDEYKKRHGGVSPDFWDAFMLAATATRDASDVVDV